MQELLRELKEDFLRFEIPQLAGAVSYFIFLSVVPFFLLLVSVVGFIGSYLPHFGVDLEFYFSTIFGKYGEQAYLFANDIIKKRFIYGIVGFLALLLSFSFSITPLEWALKRIFGEKRSSSFLKQRLIGFLIFAVITAILYMAAFLLAELQVVLALVQRWQFISMFVNSRHNYVLLSSLLLSVLFMLSIVVSSYLVYRWLTVKRPSKKSAALGALFTGVSVEIGRQLYLAYLRNFPIYDIIYGTFSFFIVTLVFIYFASAFFLTGAVLVKHLDKRKAVEENTYTRYSIHKRD
jgi:membrane protein